LPALVQGPVRFGDTSSSGAAILCPIGAAAFNLSAAFCIGSICAESSSRRALQLVAAVAETHKIFGNHCATVGFCDQMPASVSVPCTTCDAAIKARKYCFADFCGDMRFFSHLNSSYTYKYRDFCT